MATETQYEEFIDAVIGLIGEKDYKSAEELLEKYYSCKNQLDTDYYEIKIKCVLIRFNEADPIEALSAKSIQQLDDLLEKYHNLCNDEDSIQTWHNVKSSVSLDIVHKQIDLYTREKLYNEALEVVEQFRKDEPEDIVLYYSLVRLVLQREWQNTPVTDNNHEIIEQSVVDAYKRWEESCVNEGQKKEYTDCYNDAFIKIKQEKNDEKRRLSEEIVVKKEAPMEQKTNEKAQSIKKPGLLLKYPKSEIMVSSSNNVEFPSDIKALESQIDSVQSEIQVLTTDLAKIDKSISDFCRSCDNVALNVNKIGTMLIDKTSNGDATKAKGYLGMISLAIKGFGYLEGNAKKKKAVENYNIKVNELMSEKRDVAKEKLPYLRQTLNKISGLFNQFENFYSKEYSKVTTIDDPAIVMKILLYRKSLCMVVKTRFLQHTIEYYIAEMEAWLEGRNDSKQKSPKLIKEFENEIIGWPSKLMGNHSSFEQFIISEMARQKGEIALPVATLLSDPCLFRHFIGINFGQIDNCSCALIDMTQDLGFIKNPLVFENVYFRHCKDIFEKQYYLPRRPSKFNILDVLVLLVLPAVLFGILLLIFTIESATGWRIFFMIPALCWVGFGIEYLETNYEKIFPYVSRLSKYNEECSELKRAILKAENCQEVHIIS